MDISKYDAGGGLVISEDAISAIAINAAKDVDGVAGFSNKATDVVSTIRSGSLKVMSPVRVVLEGDELLINIYINVLPGKKIQPIATDVQRVVKEAVQNMTGRLVLKVNVIVVSLEDEKETEDGKDK
ncbi:MAG: Asp23/Gls24 family envelope stress response protein [Clostridiales bacterium]|nr:Asp23/Gls24 family envelope stress response protein [Clostridiales bacterium]